MNPVLGGITGLPCLGCGLDARLTTLLCKEFTIAKSQEVKTGWPNSQEETSLTESAKEGCVSERTVIADDDD